MVEEFSPEEATEEKIMYAAIALTGEGIVGLQVLTRCPSADGRMRITSMRMFEAYLVEHEVCEPAWYPRIAPSGYLRLTENRRRRPAAERFRYVHDLGVIDFRLLFRPLIGGIAPNILEIGDDAFGWSRALLMLSDHGADAFQRRRRCCRAVRLARLLAFRSARHAEPST